MRMDPYNPVKESMGSTSGGFRVDPYRGYVGFRVSQNLEYLFWGSQYDKDYCMPVNMA